MLIECCQCHNNFKMHPSRAKRGSKRFFCSLPCYNEWRRLHHPRLGTGNFHPSKEELESLYVDKKLSQNAIAKQYGVSGALISIWIQRHGIPSTHLNVANLNSTGDLWYIVGVMLGDGTFDNSRYGVKLACRDEVFALSFQNSLRKLGLRTHKWVQTFREKPVYIAVARSKNLYNWLKQALNNLEVMPKEFIKDFIRGFYESEGCLYKSRQWKNYFQLFFTNTNEALIRLTQRLVEAEGYKTSLFKHKQHGWGTKPVYTLYVLGSREEKLKFLDWVNPCISRKTSKAS